MLKFEPAASQSRIFGQLLWFLFWVGVTVVAAWLSPNPSGHGTHHRLGLPPCAVPTLYHRLCPGCGLTTSFTAIVHGDFGAAIRANLFGPILYGVFTVTALISGAAYFRKLRWNTDSKGFTWFLVALVGVYLAYGFWRMATVELKPQGSSLQRYVNP